MRILVLYSDTHSERLDEHDTLTQRDQVLEILYALGHEVSSLAFTTFSHLETSLDLKKPDLIFNLVESFNGSDSDTYLIPGYLDAINMPYTGCSADTLFLARDKRLTKKIMHAFGVPTAPYQGSRYIVKSCTEHASFGITQASVVDSLAAAERLVLQKSQQYGGTWFYEAYIHGREINVPLFPYQGKMILLPISEICFKQQKDVNIFDYAGKWDEASESYENTDRQFLNPRKDAALINRLKKIAQDCSAAFNILGYARIDFRVDAEENPFALELNANPCLALDAGIMAAAHEQGLSPYNVIHHLVVHAMERKHYNLALLV